jgi:hypothetical protein
MIVSVVGCGESAKNWYKTPRDYSIGVNDCFKFDEHPNTLILINAPFKFEPTKDNNYIDRLSVIKRTKPAEVLTNDRGLWSKYFNCAVEEVRMQKFWKPELTQKGNLYHSNTSPFVAINYAYNIGATEIIIWGVDFKTHRDFKAGERKTMYEIEQYLTLINFIKSKGVKVWVGAEGAAFLQIPIYERD